MSRPRENGNALFIILIGIALFAALSFVATRSGDSTNTVKRDTGRLAAADMLQFGSGMRIMLDKMIVLGATTETTPTLFAEPLNANYGVRGTAPAAELFSATGGGLTYLTPPSAACPAGCSYEFTGQIAVTGVGTDPGGDSSYELALVVPGIEAVVCGQINAVLNNGDATVPTGAVLSLVRYSGTYGAAAGSAVTVAAAPGQKTFCYRESAGAARYIFVNVLRAR